MTSLTPAYCKKSKPSRLPLSPNSVYFFGCSPLIPTYLEELIYSLIHQGFQGGIRKFASLVKTDIHILVKLDKLISNNSSKAQA